MSKAYSAIVDDAEALLQDSANAVFATTEFDTIMNEALAAISMFNPWEYKLTKTTTADSYDITLSAGDKWRLLKGSGYKGTGIVKAEYTVDQNPRRFRGLTRFGDVLSLELSTRPSSAVNVYLFMNKIHMLQKQIGTTDTAGAVKTLGAIGDITLALKLLGTDTIDEMTTVAIAGDSTVYYVTTQATITANEATVSIWPPLAAAAAVDAVVTLSLTGSTLDMILEGFLARWLAAQAAISKASKSYAQVDTAITALASAVTAIGAIATRITQGVADVASGRASAVLGKTAIEAIAARITQGITDVASGRASAGLGVMVVASIAARITQAISDLSSGRTEAAKVSAILDTANTEIDKITALLNDISGAQKDIADGKIELNKAPAVVTMATAAIGLVNARIAQALTDIISARTAIALGVTTLVQSAKEMDNFDVEAVKAQLALSMGSSLVDKITLGEGAREYMAQSAQDVTVANGFMCSGRGYLQKLSGDFNNAAADYGAAARELDAATERIREAQVNLEQANVDMAANRGIIEIAITKIRICQTYINEAQGYVMEANTRMANNASYTQSALGELRAGSSKAEEARADIANADSYLQIGNAELRVGASKAGEAAADHANAGSYFSAAASEFRGAGEKTQEAIANLRLVATRLQVSAGGLRYEEWGRRELANLQKEMLAYGGYPRSIRYARD